MYKDRKQIRLNIRGGSNLLWIVSPLLAIIAAFFILFFLNLPEMRPVATKENDHILLCFNIAIAFLIGFLVVLVYLMWMQKKRNKHLAARQSAKNQSDQLKIELLQQSLSDKLNLQDELSRELKFRQGEMMTMAMSIIQKNEFLNELKDEVVKIKSKVSAPETRQALSKLSLMITQDISIDRDREKFQMNIHAQHSNFTHKLKEAFPSMTENEIRLASMLRLNLSSKEIASILNISPKSVEMNRYRLRKKLKVDPKVSINDFIRDF